MTFFRGEWRAGSSDMGILRSPQNDKKNTNMLFIIILIFSFAAGFFMPWWVACIIAFLAAVWFGKTTKRTFLSGFFGVAITWIVLALCKSIPNNHILATRVAHLFHLPGWGALLAVTAVIGGLAGGLSALSGVLTKKAFD